MTDQTRWGIDLVQQKNKQKVYAEQKEMREEVQDFISNCSVFRLQKMYERMKELKQLRTKQEILGIPCLVSLILTWLLAKIF